MSQSGVSSTGLSPQELYALQRVPIVYYDRVQGQLIVVNDHIQQLQEFTGYYDTYNEADLLTRIIALEAQVALLDPGSTEDNDLLQYLNKLRENLQDYSGSDPNNTPMQDAQDFYDTLEGEKTKLADLTDVVDGIRVDADDMVDFTGKGTEAGLGLMESLSSAGLSGGLSSWISGLGAWTGLGAGAIAGAGLAAGSVANVLSGLKAYTGYDENNPPQTSSQQQQIDSISTDVNDLWQFSYGMKNSYDPQLATLNLEMDDVQEALQNLQGQTGEWRFDQISKGDTKLAIMTGTVIDNDTFNFYDKAEPANIFMRIYRTATLNTNPVVRMESYQVNTRYAISAQSSMSGIVELSLNPLDMTVYINNARLRLHEESSQNPIYDNEAASKYYVDQMINTSQTGMVTTSQMQQAIANAVVNLVTQASLAAQLSLNVYNLWSQNHQTCLLVQNNNPRLLLYDEQNPSMWYLKFSLTKDLSDMRFGTLTTPDGLTIATENQSQASVILGRNGQHVFSGPVLASAQPILASQLVNKNYVDSTFLTETTANTLYPTKSYVANTYATSSYVDLVFPTKTYVSNTYATTQYVDNKFASTGSGFTNMVFLTSAGSGTWTAPANVYKIKVTLTGAGAGSGSAPATSYISVGQGGAGGGTAIKIFSGIVPGTSYSYVIGTGGAAGSSGAPTTFTVGSVTLSATGGTFNGNGGVGQNGDVNIYGGYAGLNYQGNISQNVSGYSGSGGSSYFHPGNKSLIGSTNGVAGVYGSGASGAINTQNNGQNYIGAAGGNGCILIEY